MDRQNHSPARATLHRAQSQRRTSASAASWQAAEMKAPPFWAMYVGVPKLEEAVSHITRLGGKTHTEVISIPNVGRMQ
jgi:predicted enzyme related to lactoylglutathione lyase